MYKRQLLVLLTKCDKLGFEQRIKVKRAVVKQLAEAFPGRGIEVIVFSAPDRLGLDETRAKIEAWLAPAPDGADQPAQAAAPEN